MRRILCQLRIHRWEHHINREASGPGGGYDLCSRCGRERTTYDEKGNPALKGQVPLF